MYAALHILSHSALVIACITGSDKASGGAWGKFEPPHISETTTIHVMILHELKGVSLAGQEYTKFSRFQR